MTTKITMFLGSMDHSPSEQLGKPCEWHTTVLILSEGGEHWKLADDLAKCTRCKNGALMRWSDRRRKRREVYKESFEEALAKRLSAYPVHVHAISARAKSVEASLSHIITELGLIEKVQSVAKKGKKYINFGPFQQVTFVGGQDGDLQRQTEPVNFVLPERQGISLLFICHYVLRVHQRMMQLLNRDRPELEWIDWQVMPNKFPGDIDGPMASLFHAIMSGASHQRLVSGNIRVATFNESQADHGSILADNIAGLISDKLDREEFKLKPIKSHIKGASLFWEVWEPVD